jgi:hypothetical protein
VLNNDSKSIIFSNSTDKIEGINIIKNDFNESESLINNIYNQGIQSVIVEGGRKTLQYFIDNNFWNCMRVIRTNKKLNKGTPRPNFDINGYDYEMVEDDKLYEIFRN